MKFTTLSLAGALVAGSFIAPALAQPQTPSQPQPQVRQRAPGVPMAPRADVARLRDQGDQTERSQSERSPPMPRGVPSIIAP